ncbi:ABC transporter permease [Siphonobacter sp. SORGH_AS_1065]|uniref:ABC transporter permease n=1 Tax=Siphonobacter sp. SORGH_AS_1065 TaxID=3041795 RepID=UPI0027847125|nr:FtsX-like permease family protein [Siphonobacter sp. SORGH_AS_1065]MDQ1085797.1 putative ABC transport system permease protein [Siphonobacter sp. SORGH_AS_1065]
MLQNYLKIAWRSLWKNRLFSTVNLTGLALGLTASLLILEYVSFERSFNTFHPKLARLYRVLMQPQSGSTQSSSAPGVILRANFPELESYCRIAEGLGNGMVRVAEKTIREDKTIYADASLFHLFQFPVQSGSVSELNKPRTVGLSLREAEKLFGNAAAVGQPITVDNQFGKTEYTVALVYENMPENSDIQADIIFSMATLANPSVIKDNSWVDPAGVGAQFVTTYVLLTPQAEALRAEQKFNQLLKTLPTGSTDQIRLQAVQFQHLGASLTDSFTTFGNLGFVYLMSGIASLILLIAWFNYVNLSTALVSKRSKEVGVRKVIGAHRFQIIGQFLGESIILNIIALLIAFVVVDVLQSPFNALIQKNLSLSVLFDSHYWLYAFIFFLAGIGVSGFYTAFALSGINPLLSLKGGWLKSGKSWLRQSLVLFQFSISITLIAATFIVYQQLHYMQRKNLGVTLQQRLVMQGPEVGRDSTFLTRTAGFRNALSQLPFVTAFSSSGNVPGSGFNFSTENVLRTDQSSPDQKTSFAVLICDDQFFKTYGISLASGRSFTKSETEKSWGDVHAFMVNEATADKLGYSPSAILGKTVLFNGQAVEVVGVVKNYHHLGLKEAIQPIVYWPQQNTTYLTAEISTDHVHEHIQQLKAAYERYFPGNLFSFYFADEHYNRQYQTEQQYSSLFTLASGLSIFIACLGLLGLAAFSAEQRTKEIGIRKVLGASVLQISTLLTRDYIKLVAIALLISIPLVWVTMDRWLEQFAYHVSVQWWVFAEAGLLTLLIALGTVSYQSIRAALTNPVRSLKSE